MQKQVISNATLYCGDALEILPTLTPDVNGVITDPPYSSGGLNRNELHPELSGTDRDQRSWAFWCSQWIALSYRLMLPGAYFMAFTDWRFLPSMTDAVQAGGVMWRGLVVWDKTHSARAPHTGYFRHQAEYVVWGSTGKLARCPHGGPFPGVISCRVNPAEKLHMTGKPLPVMAELIKPLSDTAHILDPFMGSGSTAIPVLQRGGRFTGIEMSQEYFDIACTRIEQALALTGR
ncbi:site-specific DNA-methyltransferase [Erwinia psidii]|uniref:DNA-methyltransferase n=1 Tax=Erwinia psidii TaxID=69224 RepID=UPI00226B4E04|nr:site-specific DNA-methyltransferase [Erwinia psidii]MCX8962148.1 site-specific DNA-methyltransferase [Erwinia psidii]